MSYHSPRVSIGVPVYNGERFLAETLDYILAQTFEDLELIISDNASTDSTADICREYAARDKRIRYYRNETNLGAVRNYNRTFELSSGEYFKWLAADDVCAPQFLERCVEALDREPTAVLAYPIAKWIDEEGEVLIDYDQIVRRTAWRLEPQGRFRQLIDEWLYDSARPSQMYIFALFRSSALRQTRLLPCFAACEYHLLAELALMGNFCEVAEFLSFLRLHPASLSVLHTRGIKTVRDFMNPAIKGAIPLLLFRWRHYVERFGLVLRSRLRLREKVALLFYSIGPPLTQLRKKLRN